jgi:hypothetical protein
MSMSFLCAAPIRLHADLVHLCMTPRADRDTAAARSTASISGLAGTWAPDPHWPDKISQIANEIRNSE